MASSELSIARRPMLDRYEILAEIASGGMATVFLGRLASAPGFERLVAIKKLHPHLAKETDFVEMFLDEARIAARIHHPNVVATLEFGTSPQGHFLVMEYVEGPTLAKMLSKASQKGERIPQPVALRIVHDALAGLQVAHELTDENGKALDVVHRDVSPQNILVGVGGTARITDFGVARAWGRIAVTRTGQLKGKLSYMAPEQARGEETDRRSDIFAMGILLWESLAAKRLFRGRTDSEAETLSRVLYADIPRLSSVLPDVHPMLDEICARALQRRPEDRFPSCAEFLEALEEADREGARMGSARDVARYVEQFFGDEIAQRRESLRGLAPAEVPPPLSSSGIRSDDSFSGIPQGLSSVSSASMSLAGARPRSVPPQPAPAAPRTQGVLVGALALVSVVALSAIGAMVWVVSRSAPVPVTPAAASAPSLAASVASVAPAVSAPPAPSAEASATASASASAAPRPPPPAALGPAKKAPVQPAGGLGANPYR